MLQKVEYSRIKDERVMRACTGVDFARLEDLSQILGSYYKKTHGICYFEMIRNLNLKDGILFSDYRDIVFFVLYCKKVGNTYDVLGVTFGTSGANVHHNVSKFTPILAAALAELGHAPLRDITSSEDLAKLGKAGDKKIIDGTEIPIEKPKNKAIRDKSYSVKKKILHKNDDNKRKK